MDRDFSPTREIVDWWATSADGERLALAVDRLRGGSAVLDIGPTSALSQVIVYDIRRREWVHSLDGKKQGAKHISALALSPDGRCWPGSTRMGCSSFTAYRRLWVRLA